MRVHLCQSVVEHLIRLPLAAIFNLPSIGRTSVPACHYDVNRGRLTYLRGRGVCVNMPLTHPLIPSF